jgi:hypothetical protein
MAYTTNYMSIFYQFWSTLCPLLYKLSVFCKNILNPWIAEVMEKKLMKAFHTRRCVGAYLYFFFFFDGTTAQCEQSPL